jgi:adenosine deaminase
VIELAVDIGYRELPAGDPVELGRWFTRRADRKSLGLYLEGLRNTIALLQTRDAIERMAADCAEELAADNVVDAQVRYAPELSTEGGLKLDEVVVATLDGFREDERRAQAPEAGDEAARVRHAAGGPLRWRSRSSRCATVTRASSVSISPGPRPGSRPRVISTPSS